jgi:hypothetical protein
VKHRETLSIKELRQSFSKGAEGQLGELPNHFLQRVGGRCVWSHYVDFGEICGNLVNIVRIRLFLATSVEIVLTASHGLSARTVV